MAIDLYYGTYKFPIAPMVTIARRPAQGVAQPQAYTQTWTIRGELFEPGSGALEGYILLREKLASAFSQQNDLLWVDGHNVVKALRHASAIGGLTISVNLPEDPTAYATHVPYQIEVSGTFMSQHLDADGVVTFNPADLIFGEYTAHEERQSNELIKRLSGRFHGQSPLHLRMAIDNLQTSVPGVLLRKSVQLQYDSSGRFTNQIQFAMDLVDSSASPDVFDVDEVIEVQQGGSYAVPRLLLGGRDPVFQSGPVQPTIIVQHGSAVGRTTYPSTAIYGVKCLPLPEIEPPSFVRESPIPRPDGSGYHQFRLSWRRVMASPSTVDISLPQPLVAPI